jgi:heme ABC exporter ATP-binding subunit CcmA
MGAGVDLAWASEGLSALAATPCGNPAIEVRRLSFERGGRLLLNSIDLRIEPGRITAVLGANGVGKTTLLRCLAGLARPTSGDVTWLGQSREGNADLRRLIGMVAHQDWVYSGLTPRENLFFCAQMCGVSSPVSRIEQLLAEAKLLLWADKPTIQLSHGLRRRLSVCRALVHDPPILLLDEPFSGLDEQGQQWLVQRLVQLRARSAAVCLTTHQPGTAQGVADDLLRLKDGKLHDISTTGIPARWQPYIREDAA